MPKTSSTKALHWLKYRMQLDPIMIQLYMAFEHHEMTTGAALTANNGAWSSPHGGQKVQLQPSKGASRTCHIVIFD
jgi:hypothetical protein